MDARESDPTPKHRATVERASERELVVTRTIDAPARLVFEAWTRPDLFQRWWVPKSFAIALVSFEADVRVGGGYRLVFAHEGATMAFFGRYLEVIPDARISWTNEEGDEEGPVTTVTFEEHEGRTRVVVRDVYPTAEALDAAIASGSTGGMPDQLDQLEELLLSGGAAS